MSLKSHISRIANKLDHESSENLLQEYNKSCNELWEQKWQFRYSDLVQFSKGHCIDCKTSLDCERAVQGLEYKKSIKEERPSLNEKLSWQNRFEELLEFREEHGHCNVPKHYLPNITLGVWVSNQRTGYRERQKGKSHYISKERIECLESIGFQCCTHNKTKHNLWQKRFEELQCYAKENGHCNVPGGYKPNVALGYWVSKQRREYRSVRRGHTSFLNLKRIKALEKIGFQWTIKNKNNDKLWLKRYKVLLHFKEKYGHCNVPSKYRENRSLGTWVNNQRIAYRKKNEGISCQFSDFRKQALEDIGFQWNCK